MADISAEELLEKVLLTLPIDAQKYLRRRATEPVGCEDEGCPHYGTPHGHTEERTGG